MGQSKRLFFFCYASDISSTKDSFKPEPCQYFVLSICCFTIPEFATNIQTDRTLQLKTGAITAATVTGILLAGKGRKSAKLFYDARKKSSMNSIFCRSKNWLWSLNIIFKLVCNEVKLFKNESGCHFCLSKDFKFFLLKGVRSGGYFTPVP